MVENSFDLVLWYLLKIYVQLIQTINMGQVGNVSLNSNRTVRYKVIGIYYVMKQN